MKYRETVYRDAVHNIITLEKDSVDDMRLLSLIGAREVQRLRGIRQLGLASLVYQSAEHSRFAHSIGVCWLATRMLERLKKYYPITPEDVTAVRCAALLHDIGHSPFSHVLENLTQIKHEVWSQRIITDPSTDVNRILTEISPDMPERVKNLINSQSTPHFLSEIISSQLDADRFDYLLRDSLMTGVKHGVFDLESILNFIKVDEKGEHIILELNTVPPIEKYLLARYHMFVLVYQHHTVRAAENMLRLILQRAKQLLANGDDNELVKTGTPFYRILKNDKDVALADYLVLNDAAINYHLSLWENHADLILSDLSRRLNRRILFKSLDVTNIDNLRDKLSQVQQCFRRANVDPAYYFSVDEIPNIPYKPYDPQHGESEKNTILIKTPEQVSEYMDIYDLSPIVRGLTEACVVSRCIFFPEKINGLELRGMIQEIFHGELPNLF